MNVLKIVVQVSVFLAQIIPPLLVVSVNLTYCIKLSFIRKQLVVNSRTTHMLRRTVNVDIKMLVRLSCTQCSLKPSVFFGRTRNMYSSSVRLQELPQSFAIVLRADV